MSGIEHRPDRRRFLSGFHRGPPAHLRRWQAADTLPATDGATLWSVSGTARDDLLVVGDDGLILTFDGHAWSQHQPTRLPLHAVRGSGAGDAVAVGWMGVICQLCDGNWRCRQGGRVDADTGRFANTVENQPLFGLWGRASDQLWAVGDLGRVVNFDGVRWSEQESGVDQHLRGVIGLPDGTLLACGMHGTILRFDHGVWHREDVGTSTNLARMWARAGDDVFAVGGHYDVSANRFVGDVLHFDGSRWHLLTPDEPLQRLRGVIGDDSTVLLFGDRGALYLLEDERFTVLESGVSHDLHDIVLFEDGALAAGDLGTLLWATGDSTQDAGAPVVHRYQSAPWEAIEQQVTDRILWSVWGASPEAVFAAGENGTVIHFDGRRWVRMETPTDLHLHGIWGTTANNLYAVGQLGLILHYDGNEWCEMHRLAVEVTAVAISGFGPHEIYVAGDEGLVLVYDGVHWQRVVSGTRDALYGIWGLDGQHMLAVGDFGTVLRWNGECWDVFNAGTESFLYGVWGSALDDIYAVGMSGIAMHFDGTGWKQQPTRQRVDLLAVTGRRGTGVVAVGTLGTAIRHDGLAWSAEPTGTERSLRAVCMTDDGTAFAVGDGGTILRRRG